MNQNRVFGIIAIAGTALLLVGIVAAFVMFDNGVFSPANGFYSELGLYTGGYLTDASALVFNAGLLLFGLALCAVMVFWGIRQGDWNFGVVSFLGILTGTLAAAMAVFTLNYSKYHYVISAAFSVAAFLFGVSYIVVSILSNRKSIGALLVAFFTAICSGLYAGFIISGGMMRVFVEDASMVGRLSFIPFAVLGWLALLLLMALQALLGAELLGDLSPAHTMPAASPAHRGVRDFDF